MQPDLAEKTISAEVGDILGLSSYGVADSFLKEHNADLHYDEADVVRDRETLGQLHLAQTNYACR